MGTRGNSKGQTPRASPEMPTTQSTDTEAGLHPLPDLRHIIISLGKKIRLFKTVDNPVSQPLINGDDVRAGRNFKKS